MDPESWLCGQHERICCLAFFECCRTLHYRQKSTSLIFLGQKKETESGNKRMTFILSLSRGWVDGWSFNLLLSSPHQIILPCSPTRNTDLILVVQRTWRFRSEDVEVSAGLGLVGVAPAQLHVEDLGPNSIGSRKSSRKCSQKPFNSRKKVMNFLL